MISSAMDPADFESVVPSEVRSGDLLASVGGKRLAENEGDGDSGGRLHKKVRGDSGGDMKRVAEIVLVLSAMGKMRGGRSPTDVEKGLMSEARQKLTEMCGALAPKDILPRDAVRVAIEDLGLNGSKDQRLGFRPPKMSIAEKLLLTKRKMEESKAFTAKSATYSSQLSQVGAGASVENRTTFLQAAHNRFPPEKPSPTPVSAGGFLPASPTVHVSALASTSSVNRLPVNDMQPAVVSKGLTSSSLEKDSSLAPPRMEGAYFRLDGRSNGPTYVSQVRANQPPEKAPTFSLQSQSFAMAKIGQINKAPDHTSIKPEGSSNIGSSQISLQAAIDQNSKSSVIQTVSGSLPTVHQPSQGMNVVQTSSLYTNHNDIARNVQKFLQPRLPEHPNWIPPSVDYMNKALTCQICKVTINDVESLLVCDACEKGVHLKCLQSYNQKGIPKGEWHCPKCLMSSNGKPLPPKYGRVTRNVSAPKVSSTTGVQASSEKKVEQLDQKVNHQKVTANGNPCLVSPTCVGSIGNNHIDSAPDLKMSNSREMQGANFTVSRIEKNNCPDTSMETAGVVCVPLSATKKETSNLHVQNSGSSSCDTERSNSEPKSLLKFEPGYFCPEKPSDAGIDSCHRLQAPCNSQDVEKTGPLNHVNDSIPKELDTSDLRETFECKPGCDIRQDDQDIAQANSVGTTNVGNGALDCNRSSSDDLPSVAWVGNILKVVDEKAFYQSCRINGVVYKLQDYALFRSNKDNLTPSKLQALWEDNKTRSKWALVNRCYLPGDLPEVVHQPCTPESNEVYESYHDSTVMAGLIQGPCQVLPPNKLKEESERRIHLQHGANNGLQPVFLCKWFYDESKGLFRPVTN